MWALKEMANCAGECWAGRGALPSPGPSAQPDSLVQVPCVNTELNFSAGTAPARPRTITSQLLLPQIQTIMQGHLALPRIKWPVASGQQTRDRPATSGSEPDRQSLSSHGPQVQYKCLPED